MNDLLELDDIPGEDDPNEGRAWTLRKLKPVHKQICALLAQGLKQVDIAKVCNVTSPYVHMLTKQPLCIAYIQDMSAVAGVQLDALFVRSVEVISDTMQNGNPTEQLKAARLQLEATKRIGPRTAAPASDIDAMERLTLLAERLTKLNTGGAGYSGGGTAIEGRFLDVTHEGTSP